MALTAGSIEIKLFADIARLQADMNKANKTVDTAMRNIDKSVTMAKNALGGLAGAFGIASVLKIADEYKKFDSQIKLATKSLEKYNIAYKDVARIARESQSDIGAIGILYARLTNNLRDFGTSQKEIGMITESVALSLRVSNATVQETNSVMLQLSQSFGSGKINGQEFLAVSEGAPIIMRQLANSLNVTYGELKNMSTQGELTAEVLAKALTDPAYLAGLQEQVKSVGTISSAITVLKNNFTLFVGEADKADGVSTKISQTIILLADNLNLLANAALVAVGAQLGKFVIGINASIRASQVRQVEIVKENLLLEKKALTETASTLALTNNAKATTAWAAANSIAMREAHALNTAVAASSTLAARAINGLTIAFRALGGPVGIAITGIILFGDSILKWIDKARGMTPELKNINDQIERTKKLTAQGITSSDVMADEKTKINDTVKLIATLQEQRDKVATMGKNAGLYMMFSTPKEKIAEIDAQIAQGRKNILDYANTIAQAADIEANKVNKVSEEYTKLSKTLATNKELAIAYSNDMKTIMLEGKKAGLPDDEILEKLSILKEKYDKATGATKALTQAKKEQAKTLKELQDDFREEDLLIERSANINDLLKEKMDEVNKVQIETQKAIDDKIAKLVIEIDTYGKTEAAIEATNLARLTERKLLLESKGENVDALNAEIAARMKLVDLTSKKQELDLEKERVKEAEKVAEELKKVNDKVAEDFNKSLTDAIFRGFESGKSFAKTFKDSLVNSFKTLILRPIVSFIVDSSGIAKVMGAITGGVSGTANAGGIDGITGAASSVWQGITSGFETANIAFEQSIQQFGSWIANFSDGTGALADIGGAIGEYSGAISQALPYAGSVMKLLQGDFLSAGFTAAGTAIGTALGGPIGGMVGSFLGSAVGGLFGGAKTYRSQVESSFTDGQFTASKATGAGSRLLKGADQPLTELSQAFATTLSGLFKAANLDVDMELSAQIGKKKRSWASFTATIGDEVFKTVVGANKGGLEKTLETLVGQTFSDVMIKAIKASDLQTGIKELFDGLTDKDEIAQMSAAAQMLMKEYGSLAGKVAEVASASTDSTEELLNFIKAIDGVKTGVNNALFSMMTPVEQASAMLTELGTIFGSLNLTVPKSISELQTLAKSIDYTTSAGLTLASAMPKLVAAYTAAQQAAEQVLANAKANTASAKQALTEVFNAKALGIQDTITKFKNFGDSIRAFRLSLGERVAGGGSPLLAARTRFDTVSALALLGNEEALGNIQIASTDYLNAFETYSGSFIDYQRAFAKVSETLLGVENSSYSTASVAQLQLDSLNAQYGTLVSIDNGIANLSVALANYQSAIQAESAATSALNIAKANASAAAEAAAKPAVAEVAKKSVAGLTSGALTNILNKELGSTAATQQVFKDIKATGTRLNSPALQDYIRTNFSDKYFAQGGVFTNGIVSSPTAFNVGLMGEKGAEAIMPLTNINGSLGVTTNNSEMVKQLEIISDKISRLESVQIATAQNTGKVARIVERADNGDSLNVTVVT
jgi:tape measure domain-containing protein